MQALTPTSLLRSCIVFFLALPGLTSARGLDCADLKDQGPPGAAFTSVLQPAGEFVIPRERGPKRSVDLPAFCRASGVLRPTADSRITFEVWLPAENWNGRFQGIGNVGFGGSIDYMALVKALQAGYAAAATDTGHQAAVTDAVWARHQVEKLVDFGWRALHLTTVAGKSLAKAFYGSPPRYSYFNSCSNGGRQGLMEAQQFPQDYDGIMAGSPAYNWTGLYTDYVWNAQALSKAGAAISAAQTSAIKERVLAQCDALDGIDDGLINDPRRCTVDTQKLLCTDGESDSCLTTPQIRALEAIYQGPRTSDGTPIYFGFPPGGETAPGSPGWELWIFGADPGQSLQQVLGSNFIRYMVGAAEHWVPADFDFDHDFGPLEKKIAPALNATNPDLSRFAAHGGKLILYHGWSDPAIPATGTIAYRDQVLRQMGERRADDFIRLFMVPGMHHCAGGTGPSDFGQGGAPVPGADPATNLAAALETWVEAGTPPGQVIAHTAPATQGNDSVRTGLLCAYPKTALLRQGADPMLAESYTCGDPRSR
jgi:feruloyl esterase